MEERRGCCERPRDAVERNGAKRSTGEKSRKPGAAVGAFIAYGSAKHLWNNGAAKYIVGRRKTKVFSTRENPQDRVLLLAAGVPVVRMHVRYTYTLKSKIDTFSVSIPGLVIAAAEPAETEREEKRKKGNRGRKRRKKKERERARERERSPRSSVIRIFYRFQRILRGALLLH